MVKIIVLLTNSHTCSKRDSTRQKEQNHYEDVKRIPSHDQCTYSYAIHESLLSCLKTLHIATCQI